RRHHHRDGSLHAGVLHLAHGLGDVRVPVAHAEPDLPALALASRLVQRLLDAVGLRLGQLEDRRATANLLVAVLGLAEDLFRRRPMMPHVEQVRANVFHLVRAAIGHDEQVMGRPGGRCVGHWEEAPCMWWYETGMRRPGEAVTSVNMNKVPYRR